MRSIAIALLAALAARAQNQISDESVENVKHVTVMINAAIDGDTRPGVGIIFALANDRVYIVTANHLVRRGISKANDIQVEFRWLPGEPIPAQLLTYFDEKALDLAVIVVDNARARAERAGLSLDRLGDPSALAQGVRGAPVWAIGYPNGTAYDVSAAQISQVEAVSLKYRVSGLVPGGYSGGPLIDRNGLIVGMIRQDQPPNGEATRFDRVVEQLQAWSYQVGLRKPGTSPAPVTRNQPPVEFAAPPRSAGVDSLRDTLLRYVAEAPTGFVALGGKRGEANWSPSVTFADAVSCKGFWSNSDPVISCDMSIMPDLAGAVSKFGDLDRNVEGMLPGWTRDHPSYDNRTDYLNRTTFDDSTVVVEVRVLSRGRENTVQLLVEGKKVQ